MSQLKVIKVSDIRESPVALREVNKTSEEYLGLVDSIRIRGVMNPINVRLMKDPDTGQEFYSLIDGLHRFNAAKDAGLTEIPAQVLSLGDAEVLEAQIMANIHKVETRPVEYSRQLTRMLTANPLFTIAELSSKLAKSPTWLHERLNLVKLTPEIASLVDEGKINVTNAYALAKLPPEEQANFVDRALTQQPTEFVPTVQTRMKEIRDARRQGRDAKSEEFVPIPRLQKIADIKRELDSPTVGPVLIKLEGAKSAQEGFQLAIKWMLHLDTQSIDVDRNKDAERKKLLADAKAKRDLERNQAKAEAAAKKAAELQKKIAVPA